MAEIRGLTKADFDFIVTVLDRWWGGPSGERAHPIFFYELGRDALVAHADGSVVGFLMGFVAPTDPPLGYVHLVGIHPEYRRRGVGKQLYERFIDRCRLGNAKSLKAITSLGNQGSIDFHRALGFVVAEETDYAGPGRGRIVFTKAL